MLTDHKTDKQGNYERHIKLFVCGTAVGLHWAVACHILCEENFCYLHMPVSGGNTVPSSPEAVAESYLAMLDAQMDNIVDTILAAKHNVLYFCGAGKDRTGVVSAVLLKKLGYDDKTIIDDYMKTKENLYDYLKSYAKEHPKVDINTIMPNECNIKAILKVIKDDNKNG